MSKDSSISSWLYSKHSKYSKHFTRKARTISVTSGKGGVGKTFFSVSFATVLAAKGYKVLLIDCDYNLSNCFLALNITPKKDLLDYYKGEGIHNCLSMYENLSLLSGRNGDNEIFSKKINLVDTILSAIVNLESEYDFIILDSPAGIDNNSLSLNAYSDYRFIVTNPDKFSITDSYSLMKILSKNYGVDRHFVIGNKIRRPAEFNSIVKSIGETSSRFLNCRVEFLGKISECQTPVTNFLNKNLREEYSSSYQEIAKVCEVFFEKMIDGQIVNFEGLEKRQDVFFDQLRSNKCHLSPNA